MNCAFCENTELTDAQLDFCEGCLGFVCHVCHVNECPISKEVVW
jgi:hypothetical protein